MCAKYDCDATTWSFEPTWDPNAAWDYYWQQPGTGIGAGIGSSGSGSGTAPAVPLLPLDPLDPLEPWNDFPELPLQQHQQQQQPQERPSSPTASLSSPASSTMMMMATPQQLYQETGTISGGDTSASVSVCEFGSFSPTGNDTLFSIDAMATRPKLAPRRRSSAVAAKAAVNNTGRSRSWSAAVTAAPMYKYVAHAQLAMQCGQPKNCIENQNAWLQIARISHERWRVVTDRFVQKKGSGSGDNVVVVTSRSREVADHVLVLFSQHYVREKIAILASEHVKSAGARGDDVSDGDVESDTDTRPPQQQQKPQSLLQALQRRDLDSANNFLWLDQSVPRNTTTQAKQFPRLTVFDESCHQQPNSSLAPGLLAVEVRTSSGYNNFTASSTQNASLSEWDCDLLQLRHMSLLRESEDRRRKNKYYEFIEGKMKRPLNSFMLYRSALMKAVAILKVCSVVTDTCQMLSQHYPQLTESQLLAVVGSVVQNIELPFTLPVEIDRDVVLAAIHATMYEPVDTTNPDSKLKPVDPKFSNQTDVAQIITLMWNTEPEDFKHRFVEFSQIEKQHHHQVYPKYKYCPVKRERSST
ncbi:LAFA_0E00584g1_1 [Lachancea sp. 'fantastica']|nr:LAFA_0E00584g1_1 [Lachancea sp. 'fantastica']